jgi:hypothetical protein
VQAGSTAVFLAVLVAAAVSTAAGLLMPHTRAEDVAHGGTDTDTVGVTERGHSGGHLVEPSTRSTDSTTA